MSTRLASSHEDKLQHGESWHFLIGFQTGRTGRRIVIERIAFHHRSAGLVKWRAGRCGGVGRYLSVILVVSRESMVTGGRSGRHLFAHRAANNIVVHIGRCVLLLLLRLDVLVVHSGRVSGSMVDVPLMVKSEIAAQIGVEVVRSVDGRIVGAVVGVMAGVLGMKIRIMFAVIVHRRGKQIMAGVLLLLLLLLVFGWSVVVGRSDQSAAAVVLDKRIGTEGERQRLRTPFGALLLVGRTSAVRRQTGLIVRSVGRFGAGRL